MSKKPNSGPNKRNSGKDQRAAEAGFTALVDAYHNEQKTNREQQERQDNGKKWREIWTLLFVMATTGGVFLQWMELRSTDHAVQTSATAAVDAAAAAKRSADLADRTLKITEGPKIAVGNWKFQNVDANKAPTIEFKIGNSGRTDATVIEHGSMVIYGAKIPEPPPYRMFPTNVLVSSNSTWIAHVDNPPPYVIDAARFERMKNKQEFIFVYGRLVYVDVFDDVWELGYAIRYEATKDASGAVVFRDADLGDPRFAYVKKRQPSTENKN